MNEFIAPTDLSSGKIIFIAYVSSSQHRIKVKDLLWVNTQPTLYEKKPRNLKQGRNYTRHRE
jgi:hypothetical protein